MRGLGSAPRPQASAVTSQHQRQAGSTAHIDCDPARRFLALALLLTAATKFFVLNRTARSWELSLDAFGEHGGHGEDEEEHDLAKAIAICYTLESLRNAADCRYTG